MSKLIFIYFLIIISINSSYAETLCSADEKTLFQCKLDNSIKSVSLCFKIDVHKIYYKFGLPDKIDITLPTEKSGRVYISNEQFGPSQFQWVKKIIFPLGKLDYVLSTPQGISVDLSVDGLKKPFNLSCNDGDSGPQLVKVHDFMKQIGYPEN